MKCFPRAKPEGNITLYRTRTGVDFDNDAACVNGENDAACVYAGNDRDSCVDVNVNVQRICKAPFNQVT